MLERDVRQGLATILFNQAMYEQPVERSVAQQHAGSGS